MARTKQTSRASGQAVSYPRATFDNDRFSWRSKKKKKLNNSRSRYERSRFSWRSDAYDGIWASSLSYDHDNLPSSSRGLDYSFIDLDEMGHDDLDDEVLFGSLRGNIVGIRYYRGTVNNNEMVALEREPHNMYDRNAIRVKNVDGQQVGHIKRELAAALAHIMDCGWARLEGIVPFGSSNMFSMPVDLTFWGKPERKAETVLRLRSHGFFMSEAPDVQQGSSSSQSSGPSFDLSVPTRRVFLSPAEVKNELDKLFENIQEGDKSSIAEPAKAIVTNLYQHQKQALNWMIQRENGNHLPPFWEEKNGQYFNSVTVFTTKNKPKSVCGGILADDMGLGKTLEMIALIVTNFKDDQPLAVPVPGKIRHSKQLRDKQKALRLESYKKDCSFKKTAKTLSLKGDPKNFIVPDNEEPKIWKKKSLLKDIANPNNVELSPLPQLPEDEISTDIDDDSDDEQIEEIVMIQKEDPDFMPKLLDEHPAKENQSPCRPGRRPRRSIKKPARYTYSSESENEDYIDSPAKKAKVSKSVTGEEIIMSVGKGKGKSKGKGKGKGKGRQLISDAEKSCVKLPESIKDSNEALKSENDIAPVNVKISEPMKVNNEIPNTEKIKEHVIMSELSTETTEISESGTLTVKSAEDGVVLSIEDKNNISIPEVGKEMVVTASQGEIVLSDNDLPDPCVNEAKVNTSDVDLPDPSVIIGAKTTETSTVVKEVVSAELAKDVDCRGIKRGRCKVEECDCDRFERQEMDPKCAYCGDVPAKHENLQTRSTTDSSSLTSDSSKQNVAVTSSSTVTTPKPSSSKPTSAPRDELPDIYDGVELYSSPGTSKCGKTSGRTQTKGPRSTLIVCPLSVLSNWLDQLEDHVHENVHLDVYTYYGSNRTKDPNILSKQDIVLTTYSTLAADSKADNILKKVTWLRIVLDEGHVIRNPNALQTKAICALSAQRKWVLTGTPIQNSLKDLWSLVNFLQISPFTDKQWWHRAIERPLDHGDESALKRVQHLMSAIAMRRTKAQKVNDKPIIDLPERNVFVEHITLSEDERSVYDAMQKEGKLIVSKYFRQGTLLHHYGDVLAILMRLRQMCCHPLLVAKAAAAMKDVVDTLSSEPGSTISDDLREKLISSLLSVLSSGSDEECSVCLDALKQPIITRCAHVFCRKCIESVINNEKPHSRCPLCRGDIDTDKLLEVPPEQLQKGQQNGDDDDESGEISEENWKSSTKVDALMKGLIQIREEDSRIKSVVVSQFTSLLTLLEIPLRTYGFRFTRLDGSMTMKQRVKAIEEFSDMAPGSPTICLLSLKAGGVGINLTSASRIFLMDPAWNPASEEQCFDRCHRLGQTKNVTITKFIVDDSVEIRMTELQERKRQLMQGAFGNKKETPEQRRQNRIRDIKALMDF